MKGREERLSMRSVLPPIPMICVVRYCAFIRKQMAAILFQMETYLQKVLQALDLKYLQWVAAIHTVLPSTRKRPPCIGVKLARMQVKTQDMDLEAMMSLTRLRS